MIGDTKTVLRQAWMLASRTIRARYRQSIFGIAWAVLGPVALVVLFVVLKNKKVLRIDTGSIPYPLFAYCGTLMWGFFARSVKQASASLVGNMSLVRRVVFPRVVLPLSAILSHVLDLVIGLVIFCGLMVYYGQVPTWTVVFLPFVFAVQVCFMVGLSLIFAALCVFVRDVNHVLPVALSGYMFCTAVVYPIPREGALWQAVNLLNPLTPVFNAYRDLLFHGTVGAPLHLAVATVLSAAVLLFGWSRFRSMQLLFAEKI